MDNFLGILFLIGTLAVWLLAKSFIIFLHVKYKLKLSFQFAWSGHLKNIEIVKWTTRGLHDEKKLQVRVDKLWISSSLLDRNVDERLAICVNSVNVDYYTNEQDSSSGINLSEKLLFIEKLKKSTLLIKLVGYLRQFMLVFLGYFGSVMINQLKFNVNNKIISFKIDKFKGKLIDLFNMYIFHRFKNANSFLFKLNRLIYQTKRTIRWILAVVY
jgi:hypothetical protein